MKNEFMKMIVSSVKNLLGKKSTKSILKYLASVTINYACNKFNIPIYKYDPLDMKNMVYHNDSTGNKISPDETDRIIDLFSIERFVNEVNEREGNDILSMQSISNDLSKMCGDDKINEAYQTMVNNYDILKSFDLDTLETSSIVDNYEISSGGIYIPDKTIITTTNEGKIIADAKNDYLEKRLMLGENASKDDLNKLLREYYDKIEFENVMRYYN